MNLPSKPSAVTGTHAELCHAGERWWRRHGCRVTLRDPFKALVHTGECPDVIGWRDGYSVLIECKVSRSDFLADRKKPFRKKPELGMGDARLFLAPPNVIHVADLPPGWGLLIYESWRVRIEGNYPRQYTVNGYKKNKTFVGWRPLPFTGNKQCETVMLVSALARGTGVNKSP